MEAQKENTHRRPKTLTRNNRGRHKQRRRAAKRAQRQDQKERMKDAEQQEDVVQLVDGDKKLESDNLTSFEVYAGRYKVGRVNNKTDDDASSLITQEANP